MFKKYYYLLSDSELKHIVPFHVLDEQSVFGNESLWTLFTINFKYSGLFEIANFVFLIP